MTDTKSHPQFSAEVVLPVPPFTGRIQQLAYGPDGRDADIYLPATQQALPVVVFVTGYPDPGFKAMTGLSQRDIAQTVSWAKLLCSAGIAAVSYSAIEPVADGLRVLSWLKTEGRSLGIDPARIGLWSCSGNVPTTLTLLQQDAALRCALLLYGFTLDLDGGTAVLQAAAQFRFANSADPEQFVPAELPLMLLRAGQDQFAGLNAAMDSFVATALARNCSVSLINYPQGVHCFDILDGGPESRRCVAAGLTFLQRQLSF